ncbi:MAG: tripartite tricarboxylate transporter substrate binding protein, partial [Burkholderiaceae bacterium]|nr:tripartite tricarboxylate transporter substrate binding protein [Burkholderiaceae bacterium]
MFHTSLIRRAVIVAAGAVTLCAAALSSAQAAYPEKTVRMVVGFAPGGTTDLVARILSNELSTELGQPFVVENKPGAGSNLAASQVAHAKPDGYTLLMVAVTSAINETLYKKLDFNLVSDFKAVALAAKVPNILVVNPKVPANTVPELIAYIKANPGKTAYASSGSGTSIHMAGELFKQKTGLDLIHVPYKGSGPAITDLIGGQVQLMFDNMPSAWPHAQAGKLRALAVTTKKRSPSAPDLPTVAELDIPNLTDFDVASWFGVIAPAGTPDEVVDKLNAAIQKALKKPEVQARFTELGAQIEYTTPKQFADMIRLEVDTWRPVVQSSGARV